MLAFVLNSDSGGKKTRAERLYFSSQCIYVSDAVYLERDGGEDVQTVLCVFCCGFFFCGSWRFGRKEHPCENICKALTDHRMCRFSPCDVVL